MEGLRRIDESQAHKLEGSEEDRAQLLAGLSELDVAIL
jgi:hypothetical protein